MLARKVSRFLVLHHCCKLRPSLVVQIGVDRQLCDWLVIAYVTASIGCFVKDILEA